MVGNNGGKIPDLRRVPWFMPSWSALEMWVIAVIGKAESRSPFPTLVATTAPLCRAIFQSGGVPNVCRMFAVLYQRRRVRPLKSRKLRHRTGGGTAKPRARRTTVVPPVCVCVLLTPRGQHNTSRCTNLSTLRSFDAVVVTSPSCRACYTRRLVC